MTVDTAVDNRGGVGKRLLASRSFSLGQSPTTSPIQPHPASTSAGSTSSTVAGSRAAEPPRTLLRGILSQQPGVPLGLNLHILQPGHPALRPTTHGSGADYILPHTGSHHSSLLHPHAGKPGKYPTSEVLSFSSSSASPSVPAHPPHPFYNQPFFGILSPRC